MASTDVLLVTATDIESKSVLRAFERHIRNTATPRQIGDRTYFDLGTIGDVSVFLVQCEMGSSGLGGSLPTVQKAIESLSPRSVIMVGIAFGLDDQRQAIGDILVSVHLRPYEPQRVGPKTLFRGDRPHASPMLVSRLRAAHLTWETSRVHFGTMLSGEKLVDNKEFREELRAFEPEAIGGEMEGSGVYAACQDKSTDWILVKGICDWADGRKSDHQQDRQLSAATNAAEFVLYALIFAPFPSQVDGARSSPIHSSLPPQPLFFGREQELAQIADAIAPESGTWGALIDGQGGIGKTALAIRAGHLAAPSHFDRKVFLCAKVREMTSSGEQALDDFALPNYTALLTELARELGDAELCKLPENDRPNAVRRTLSEHKVLIVIDNVETFPEPEIVRLYQFLSRLPQSCKAIVTSRRSSDVDARLIRLARMKQEDAISLLSEMAKTNHYLAAAEPQERQALYDVTGGNPLLLRWTAGQLGRQASQCRTVSEACNYLRNAPPKNDPLAYIFGDLLETFSDTERRAIAGLTYFNEPVKPALVALATDLPTQQVQAALDALADRSILDNANGELYFLPRLAAGFLRDRREFAQIVAQAGSRLVDRAYAVVIDNGYEHFERFPAIEEQWPVIAAAIPRFLLKEEPRLQTLCDALWRFLDFSGRWDESLRLNQRAEEQAIITKDYLTAGKRAWRLGWTHKAREQAAETMLCATRAESHWHLCNADVERSADVLHLRGLAYVLAKDLDTATVEFKQALELYRVINPNSRRVADTLTALGNIERLSVGCDAAEPLYREALEVARLTDNRESIAAQAGSLAVIALQQKHWSEAERLSCEVLMLAQALGRQELIAYYGAVLAKALARQRRAPEGLPYANQAVDLFTKLRQPTNLRWAQKILKECENVR